MLAWKYKITGIHYIWYLTVPSDIIESFFILIENKSHPLYICISFVEWYLTMFIILAVRMPTWIHLFDCYINHYLFLHYKWIDNFNSSTGNEKRILYIAFCLSVFNVEWSFIHIFLPYFMNKQYSVLVRTRYHCALVKVDRKRM